MRCRCSLAGVVIAGLVVTGCTIEQDLTPRVAGDGEAVAEGRGEPSAEESPGDPTEEPSEEPSAVETSEATNTAPSALADAVATDEDRGVTIDVLRNDRDPDGDALTPQVASPAGRGTVTVAGTALRYVPDPDETGTDRFTYTANDGRGGSATASVTVTIRPVNDAPVAKDDRATTTEDTTLDVDVLGNDTDVDGDELSIASVGDPGRGSVTIRAGKVRYVPAEDAVGEDRFTYTVSDGNGGTDAAQVTVTIGGRNDAPVARDDSMTVTEDAGATAKNVVANDRDADGDSLSVTAVTQPAKGKVTFSGASVSFTPNRDANGSTSFSYTVSDGNGGTDTATVSVTIDPVNDAPVARDDAMTVTEDAGATAKNVVANDRDADGDSLSVTAVTQPAKGKVTFSGASVRFTPNRDANGSTSFSYTVSDGNGGSDTATVSVTIDPVNDAPVARDDSMTIRKAYEQRDVFFNVVSGAQGSGWRVNDSFSGGRDTDVDGDPMNYVGPANPSAGVGGVSVQCASSGLCQVRALNYVCGTFTFSWNYRVQDGQGGSSNLATVSVRIEAQSCIT